MRLSKEIASSLPIRSENEGDNLLYWAIYQWDKSGYLFRDPTAAQIKSHEDLSQERKVIRCIRGTVLGQVLASEDTSELLLFPSRGIGYLTPEQNRKNKGGWNLFMFPGNAVDKDFF